MPAAAQLVDVHAHLVPPEFEDLAGRFGGDRWPRMERFDSCSANLMVGQRVFRRLTDQSWDRDHRVADMERAGVSHQVVSPPPIMFCYWAQLEQGRVFSRMMNEHTARFCAAEPQHFSGMAVVPLQAPAIAVEELRHARDALGLRAVEIGTSPAGRDLDASEFEEFWAACEELDMAVFVHAGSPVLGDARLDRYYFKNLVGNPYESALAAASIVFGGVLDRHPRLRLCFAHGCGALCSLLGRFRHGWRVRPEAKAVLRCDPVEGFHRIFLDTLTHDPLVVRILAAQLGWQGIVVGTDYPFGMGDAAPAETLAAIAPPPDTRADLAWRNAARFLGVTEPAVLGLA